MARAIKRQLARHEAGGRVSTRQKQVFSVVLLLWIAAGACLDDKGVAPITPAIVDVVTHPNPHNVLSAVVTFRAIGVDSVRAAYWAADGRRESSPYQAINGDSGRIVVLGLLANTTYNITVETKREGATVASTPILLSVGSLPDALRRISFNTRGQPLPGYTITTTSVGSVGYVLAFDSVGRIAWYRAFEDGVSATDAKQLPNGHFTSFLGNTFGWQPTYGRYVEYLISGEIVQSYAAPAPYYTDNHELLITFVDGRPDRTHLFGYDLRRVDLSAIGGGSDVLLAGHTIVRQTPAGQVDFLWSSWDHFRLEDWIEEPQSFKQLANIDFDHPNSLDMDLDGHYIASWRSLAEITKIDSRTGSIIWRFGGRNNQFTILNDPLGGFNGQHCVRVLGNGHLLLYDNGSRHMPAESRAVEYAIDASTMTATLVWQFRHDPPIYTPFTGSVQRRINGNTLIGFAGAGLVTEVTPAGAVVWEGRMLVDSLPVALYRLTSIPSLYRYEVP